MSFLSGLAGDVFGGFLGHAVNSAFDTHMAQQNMEKQFKLQKELWTYQQGSKHQLEVKDLRASGLNPIISATNGSAVSGGGIGLATGLTSDNPYSTARELQVAKQNADSNSRQAGAAEKNADTQRSVGLSTVKVNDSNARYLEENATTAASLRPLQLLRQQTDINNANRLTEAQVNMFNSQGTAAMITAGANSARAMQDIEESRERSLNYKPQRMKTNFETFLLGSQNSALQLDNRRREQANKAYDFPVLGPVLATGHNPLNLLRR